MKKGISILVFTIMMATAVSAQQYEGVVTLEVGRIAESGDYLMLDMGIRVKAQAVAQHNAVRIVPELVSGDNRLELPFVDIVGKYRVQANHRWEVLRSKKYAYQEPLMSVEVGRDCDTVLHYEVQVPYEMWMDEARLVMKQEIVTDRGDIHLVTVSMNNDVELESKVPFQPAFAVALAEPEHREKRRSINGQAFLDFPQGRSDVIPSYGRNTAELAKIIGDLREVQNSPDVSFVLKLDIKGFSSPEGKYETNERLSQSRALSLKNYIKNIFSLPDNFFSVSSVAEDWAGLKALVEQSDVIGRDEILALIDNPYIVPDIRTTRIGLLYNGAPWLRLYNEMFPKLRRVDYRIDYSVKDYSLDEIRAMIGSSRDELLSHEELYRGAQGFGKGSAEYDRILSERIPTNFPDDPTALNNAAAILIEKGRLQQARSYLERAGNMPATWNNLGVIEMLSGDLDRAEDLLTRAAASSVAQARTNLEQLRLKRADNKRMERYLNR